MSDHSSHSQDRKQARALLVLGLRSLSDALWKNESITDDEIGLQALRAGAQSVREVVREVAEEGWNAQSEPPPEARSLEYREGFNAALRWVAERFNLDHEDVLALEEAIEKGPWE